MPSLSVSSALLILGNSNGLPWTTSTWQELTHVLGVPWEIEAGSAPEEAAPNVPSWTIHTAQSVANYARNLGSTSGYTAQVQYSVRKFGDNDSKGRSTWNQWIAHNWTRKWNMNRHVDQVFIDHKCSPYDVLARSNIPAVSGKLPKLEDTQVTHVVTAPLAYSLLGEAAFPPDDLDFLIPEVKNFIDTLIVQTWNRYRKGLSRESQQLKKDQEWLNEQWNTLIQEGSPPTVKMIKTYLGRVRKVMSIMTRYRDDRTIEQFTTQKERLEAMLDVANMKDDEERLEKLPRVLRDTLKKLASEKDIRDVEQLLRAALENVEPEDADTLVELPEGPLIDFTWKEGTEDLSELSVDQLWSLLGLQERILPFFQTYTDPDSLIDPWSKAGEEWLASEINSREILQPRWHQLVGIYRMLERAFEGEPVLLMDGVGIGKTFQVIGFIACLAYYRHYFENTGKFPGAFARKKWNGNEGNLPDIPFLIVCPVNLHDQWMKEIARFLRRGTFDLFPYTGKLSNRRTWWTSIFEKSLQIHSRRIILATESALLDDSSSVFKDVVRKVGEKCQKAFHYQSRVSMTLYDRRYLTFIMDEAHAARKFNKLHSAACSIRDISCNVIAMTATPVTNKLQDLWLIGHLMGIKALDDQSKYVDMTRELNRAQARDRKIERESENGADHLRKLLSGTEAHDPRRTELYPKIQKYIPWLREVFSTRVIRRTLDSVDHYGQKIFGLPTYHEHIMLLELRGWEKKELSALTNQLVEDAPLTTLVGAGKVRVKVLLVNPLLPSEVYFTMWDPMPSQISGMLPANFYIEYRRGLLHPHMNPDGHDDRWKEPKTVSEWDQMASTKLDVLANIVKHHLSKDNSPPLRVDEDGQTVLVANPSESEMDLDVNHSECDRIVIFSAFPSSNRAIFDVLTLYGIQAVELCGRTPPNRRKSVLKDFRTSDRDRGPRVLILSMVGTVGLNLACANIMIIADTLWSALDDEQLRGRIYRFPQQKEVHFYRLVARGTPDVFLNNIAFDKGLFHLAFVGLDDNTLSLFQGDGDLVYVSSDLSESEPADPENSENPALSEDSKRIERTRTNKDASRKKISRAALKKATITQTQSSRKRVAPTVMSLTEDRGLQSKRAKLGKEKEDLPILPQPSLSVNSRTSTSATMHSSVPISSSPSSETRPPISTITGASASSATTCSSPVTTVPSPVESSSRPSPSLPSLLLQPLLPPSTLSPLPTTSPVLSSNDSIFGQDLCGDTYYWDDPDNDPLIQVMQSDSISQKESYEDMVESSVSHQACTSVSHSSSTSWLDSSPPPSSRPSSPSSDVACIIPGVRSRHSVVDQTVLESSSSSNHKTMPEQIGGIPLIPSGMGRFSSVAQNRRKGKNKRLNS